MNENGAAGPCSSDISGQASFQAVQKLRGCTKEKESLALFAERDSPQGRQYIKLTGY